MTAISKSAYFDVLDNIANKYNNTVHRTLKMKSAEVTSDSHAEYNQDYNKKDPKFKVGDHVRISKYKNILLKDIPKICQKCSSLAKLQTQFHGLMF